MLDKGAFDLEGADAIARTFGKIVRPSNEPVISVLIAPSHISGVIYVVMPYGGGQLRIAIVSAKHSDRHPFACADNNLSLFADVAGPSVIIQQVDIVSGRGLAHRARFWLQPREGAYCNGRLCLTVTFHQSDSGSFEKLGIDFGIQRFAGNGAMCKFIEAIFREFFLDKETVNRRRRTE